MTHYLLIEIKCCFLVSICLWFNTSTANLLIKWFIGNS